MLFDLWDIVRDDELDPASSRIARTVVSGANILRPRVRTMEVYLRPYWQEIAWFESGAVVVQLRSLNRLTLTLTESLESEGGRVGAPVGLPESTAACLLALMHEDTLSGGPDLPMNPFGRRAVLDSYCLASSRFRETGRGATAAGEGDALVVAWPVPDWVSAVDAVAMAHWWKREMKVSAARRGEEISWNAAKLLSLVLRLSGKVDVSKVDMSGTSIPWGALGRCLDYLVSGVPDSAGARDKAFRHWALYQAPLLGTPECGLPESGAKDWLEALCRTGAKRWADMSYRRRLGESRVEQVRRGLTYRAPDGSGTADGTERATAVVDVVDAQTRSHPWHRLAGVGRVTVKDVVSVVDGIREVVGPTLFGDKMMAGLLRADLETVVQVGRTLKENAGSSPTRSLVEAWHAAIDLTNQRHIAGAVRAVGDIDQTLETDGLDFLRPTEMRTICTEPLDAGVEVQAGEIGEIDVIVGASVPKEPCGVLYALATDYSIAMGWQPVGSARKDCKWIGVRCSFGGENAAFLWPALYWYQYGGVMSAEAAWNESLAGLAARRFRAASDGHWRVNAFLYSYLEITRLLLVTRGPLRPVIKADPSARDWQGVLKAILEWRENSKSESGRSGWLGDHSCFKMRLGLFATPELGAGPAVAALILDSVLGVEGITPEFLRESRIEWAVSCLGSAKIVDATFAALRRDLPDHPWHQRVDFAPSASAIPALRRGKFPGPKKPTKP